MEGTRHERIALVIIAYIIGFTTAYIAFGLSHLTNSQVTIAENASPIAVHNALAETPQATNTHAISSLSIDNEGLFAIINGKERLLAASASVLTADAHGSVNTDGYYYKITDAEVSNDGQFAYICEQATASATTCIAYVYSLSDDSLHPVKLNSQDYQPTIEGYSSSWSNNGLLMIDTLVSQSNVKPWILATGTTSHN